jgi:transposase InsO family protein
MLSLRLTRFSSVVMITSFFGFVGELIQKVSDHSFFSKVSSQVRLLSTDYNFTRLHSTLEYQSPMEYEKEQFLKAA